MGRRKQDSTQLQDVADAIFGGDVVWHEHDLAGGHMTSRGTARGVKVERLVDKRQGDTYGAAIYSARIGADDLQFSVSDAHGRRLSLTGDEE